MNDLIQNLLKTVNKTSKLLTKAFFSPKVYCLNLETDFFFTSSHWTKISEEKSHTSKSEHKMSFTYNCIVFRTTTIFPFSQGQTEGGF